MSTKVHLQEIDWILYFPTNGNEGREFLRYGVAYRDRVRGLSQPGTRIGLEDVLEEPMIKEQYPHTVGLYVESSGRGRTFKPVYRSMRTVHSQSELFVWLQENGL